MSPIDQVLAAACALEASGKTPSLALIKSRVGNKIPMPLLIQGLQQFKSIPKAERERLAAQSKPAEASPLTVATLAQQLALLQQGIEQALALKNNEIMQLRNELIELKQRVSQLESQGKSA